MPSFETAFAETQQLLAQGDASAAFSALRPLIEDPNHEQSATQFRACLGLLAAVSEGLAGPEYAASFHALAKSPDDIELIHNVAYELHEQGQPGLSARLLIHGLDHSPSHPRLVAELIPNLEALMRNADAVAVLQGAELVDAHPIFAYSTAFNAILIDEIPLARHALGLLLDMELDPGLRDMSLAIEGMLARHAALSGVCALDAQDLVGWQLVVDGSALLHVSPEGYEGPMRGRYAFFQDDYAHIREGLESLQVVLQALDMAPEMLVAAPERGAEIVAEALSTSLGLPAHEWSPEFAETPALFIADDLRAIEDNAFLQAMSTHRPGQRLFVHASCWTEPFFYTPDATTFLFQHRLAPWAEGRMRIDADTQEISQGVADPSPTFELATRVQNAEIESPSQTPLDPLIAGLLALRELPEPHRPGLLRTSGQRAIARLGSPVVSSRFG